MSFFTRSKPPKSSSFSDFIRNAPSKDKKRMYNVVLKKATEEQNETIKLARVKQISIPLQNRDIG
jgi:hypothetical protein